MIQWVYKETAEILVRVQTILINVEIAHQAVKHGARHRTWKWQWMKVCFRVLPQWLSPSAMLVPPDVPAPQGRSLSCATEADCELLAVKAPQLGYSRPTITTTGHLRTPFSGLEHQYKIIERMSSRLDTVLQFQNRESGWRLSRVKL